MTDKDFLATLNLLPGVANLDKQLKASGKPINKEELVVRVCALILNSGASDTHVRAMAAEIGKLDNPLASLVELGIANALFIKKIATLHVGGATKGSDVCPECGEQHPLVCIAIAPIMARGQRPKKPRDNGDETSFAA